MKLFLVGGFLGSGKTTAIQKASSVLLEKGTKVGVITNDQGEELVDSQYIKSYGIPSREVVNGCFCCRFDELKTNVEFLEQSASAEVIFAESVGSCTDLVATIVKPFAKIGAGFEIIVSVFVDATILPVILSGSEIFKESVDYIYHKQIEEADLLVINKMDLLESEQAEVLAQLIMQNYPDKKVIYQNSLDEKSVENWIEVLANFDACIPRKPLDLDYDLYGAGEAALVWLDQKVVLNSVHRRAVKAANMLIDVISTQLDEMKIPIGHLKFHMDNGLEQLKISYTTAKNADRRSEMPITESKRVKLLINARVQSDSIIIQKLVDDAMAEVEKRCDCEIVRDRVLVFHPGYPTPTHRILD